MSLGPPLRLRSDEQLVELYRDGSHDAFRALHDRYRARLQAFVQATLRMRGRQDVEDTVQEIFERAAIALRLGSPPGCLRVWLYTVARNRCVDALRRRSPPPRDVFALSRGPERDTLAVAERRATVRRLMDDLRELPEQQRSALLLRELQGFSHAELGRVLGVSVPAVKGLLVRARTGLLQADLARSAPCTEIRSSLALAHDRRVKPGAHARRHLRECHSCRTYRAGLRRSSRSIAALVPGPGLSLLLLSILRKAAAPVKAAGLPSAKGAAVLACAGAAAVGVGPGRSALLGGGGSSHAARPAARALAASSPLQEQRARTHSASPRARGGRRAAASHLARTLAARTRLGQTQTRAQGTQAGRPPAGHPPRRPDSAPSDGAGSQQSLLTAPAAVASSATQLAQRTAASVSAPLDSLPRQNTTLAGVDAVAGSVPGGGGSAANARP